MFFSFHSEAETTIAVLDNIIDTTHPKLRPYLHYNSGEVLNSYDDDRNGKVDDVNGWNFINEDHLVFNEAQRGDFPKEVFLYYELRAKKTLDTITDDEMQEYKDLRKDDDFMDKRKEFSRYTHGSHVACLALDKRNYPKYIRKSDIKLFPVTYLGDATKGEFLLKDFVPTKSTSTSKRIRHIENYIEYYISFMRNKFLKAIDYSASHADIIHASWGQGYGSTENIVENLFEEQFGDERAKNFKKKRSSMTRDFMAGLIRNGERIVRKHSDKLFVFSAGNRKENTDESPHYPSSIKAANAITVGASHNGEKAYFSNFGRSSVTISAPGIAIRSCTPERRRIPINGTSQAAPQVTKASSIIREILIRKGIRPTPSMIKEIIVRTAKYQKDLVGFNSSSGALNLKAAIRLTERLRR